MRRPRTEDVAPGRARPEGEPGARAEGEPGARAEGEPGARAEGEPGARPASEPGARPEGEPGARKLRASGADAGQALAPWLALRLGLGAPLAEERVRGGAVYVAGRRVRDPGKLLCAGDAIVVHELPPAAPASWRVVHADAEVIAVEKPAGLAVTAGRSGGAALEELVAQRYPGARAFHRIDQGTSGLVLFARGDGARRLAAALAAGALEREYRAVVAAPGPEPRVLDAVIGPDPADRRRMRAGVAGGKPARTEVWTLERGGGRALVGARLHTGLTHQIRVHLAHVGLPIVGDRLYGGAPAERLALHAARLAWPGGAAESPLPDALRALLGGGA
jgi:23S rRNA pseudouridine1911/1915/1917 synthase